MPNTKPRPMATMARTPLAPMATIEWALGKRFEMITSRPGDKPGYHVRIVLDFTVVSGDPVTRTLRVHVNDAMKSRQLIGMDAFYDGICTGVLQEVAKPPIVHERREGEPKTVSR